LSNCTNPPWKTCANWESAETTDRRGNPFCVLTELAPVNSVSTNKEFNLRVEVRILVTVGGWLRFRREELVAHPWGPFPKAPCGPCNGGACRAPAPAAASPWAAYTVCDQAYGYGVQTQRVIGGGLPPPPPPSDFSPVAMSNGGGEVGLGSHIPPQTEPSPLSVVSHTNGCDPKLNPTYVSARLKNEQ